MWLHQMFPFLKGRKSDSRSLRRYAEYQNNLQWQDVFTRYFNILVDQFEWSGLPTTIDSYFFESTLLWDGISCILFDEEYESFLGLPTAQAGGLNLYNQPCFYRAYSVDYNKKFIALTKYNQPIIRKLISEYGNSDTISRAGCVCFDNPQQYSYINTLEIYTSKLVNAMRAIDVVQNQAKLPTIIETDEDSKLAIQAAISDIDQNVLAVYVGNELAAKLRDTKTFPTQFNPAVLDILWAHKNNIESEMLTAFGVNNLNTNDKKERLLTDEINSNDEIIQSNLSTRLNQRKLFCENMNAVFGLSMSVKAKEIESQNVGIAERRDGGATDGTN